MGLTSEIDGFLRDKIAIIEKIKATVTDDVLYEQYDQLHNRICMMLDILRGDAIAYYDNDMALVLLTGHTKDEIIQKWHQLGKPKIELGQAQTCTDLEKFLSNYPIKPQYISAIKSWLRSNDG